MPVASAVSQKYVPPPALPIAPDSGHQGRGMSHMCPNFVTSTMRVYALQCAIFPHIGTARKAVSALDSCLTFLLKTGI